ncbi:hypothetical protein NAEGRDRAFT_77888 [Naegleria gruberi]|uniref:Histone H2A/H2B/H3 domain-containing protein n=1 Tax=Naegleria gruberi TaxID=5762 RepID=D2UZ42_NAEGR|nr:uncharacterized protein NAEGRDRAFT_77888 [Naegleria gruberi]EFC49880.1 hypothetical protein NAEGRDRAFT_77888 [Naegleria gruberi]|eukprot:XP_002682624.1 hypothetical protein NAEGRDRAFT_77888 [Naegleria gruberi strain NEG-M]
MAPKTPAVAVQSKKKKEGVKKEAKPEASETTTTTKVVVSEPTTTKEPESSTTTEKKRGRGRPLLTDAEKKERSILRKQAYDKKREPKKNRELTNPCIQRIALKAGAHRVNSGVYDVVRTVYNELLEDILYRSAIFTIHGNRAIIKAKDVEGAITSEYLSKIPRIYPNAKDAEALASLTKEVGKNGSKDYVARDDSEDEDEEEYEPQKKKKKTVKKAAETHNDEEEHQEEAPAEEEQEPEEEPEEKKPAKKSSKKSEKTEKKSEKKTKK